MRLRLFPIITFVLAATIPAYSQSLDDLNLQLHGYATQGFLYTTHNNILTIDSSDGSAAWTEAIVNLSAVPTPRLRLSVQARYNLTGTIANAITLDFASADYKFNDRIGFRFGKVKTGAGLFNDVQDIDPAYQWALLPQSVYPLLSRNSLLAHDGGDVYGTLPLGEKFGKIEYRAWAGVVVLNANDGVFLALRDQGLALPDGNSQFSVGSALKWKTPLPGLLVGASNIRYSASTSVIASGPYSGSIAFNHFNNPTFFASYEHSRLMFAGEYSKYSGKASVAFPGIPPFEGLDYDRPWYVMATVKATTNFAFGVYESQVFNSGAPLGTARFSKDWTLSGRYDFNQYLYAKAEQHFIDGTAVLYDTANNPGGLQPTTRLSILKLGVSF